MTHPVSESEYSTFDDARILVDNRIPSQGCPKLLPTHHGRQFFSTLSRAVLNAIRMGQSIASSQHTMDNNVTEHVNHTMTQMLMVANGCQKDPHRS